MKSVAHNLTIRVFFISATFLLGTLALKAQDTLDNSHEQHYWLNGGVGVCSGSIPLSLGAILSYQTGTKLISIRYVYNTEFLRILGPEPDERIQDFGALYGIILKKTTKSLVSISGGISFVSVVRRGKPIYDGFRISEYEKLIYQTVGVALHGQFFWTPLSFFGLGVDIPVSLNKERSFIAVQYSLQVGILR